jgi:predicted neutral ceramidase superfamily lipid hydrolase
MFLHARGAHVHHLNYGIFILSAVGAILVFVTQPSDRLRKLCALLYGFGMALTFDEFGMWLHLGGSYWQRGSFDAVIVILSVFGWIAFLPKLSRMRSHHWTVAAVTTVIVVAFYFLLFTSAKTIGNRYGSWLQDIEASGPE